MNVCLVPRRWARFVSPAADPAASAAEITGLARAGSASAGGIGKFLPWILIAGAVLLGLYLLSGKKAEEMPAAADAAMEQVEGAAAEGAAAVEGAATEGAAAVEGAAAEAATAVEAAKDAATEAAPATTDGLVGAAKEATGEAAQ